MLELQKLPVADADEARDAVGAATVGETLPDADVVDDEVRERAADRHALKLGVWVCDLLPETVNVRVAHAVDVPDTDGDGE